MEVWTRTVEGQNDRCLQYSVIHGLCKAWRKTTLETSQNYGTNETALRPSCTPQQVLSRDLLTSAIPQWQGPFSGRVELSCRSTISSLSVFLSQETDCQPAGLRGEHDIVTKTEERGRRKNMPVTRNKWCEI